MDQDMWLIPVCIHHDNGRKAIFHAHTENLPCVPGAVWMLNLGCCFMFLDLRSVFNAVFFLPSQLFWKMLKECLLQRL